MQLEMIECPKCGDDFPKLRKEIYGYHVCVNCSTIKPVVGITTVEGTGDHTWNDLIIMDQDKYHAIASHAAELSGAKLQPLDILDYDRDETEVSQSIKEKVNIVINDEEDQSELVDENTKFGKVRGIDY